ncbi:unnamed protein product [Spirodela intermedia]|uniref:DYW domain-containing protein n=1 Tax=Spirodela intermedia TaxID=51605 RepID=A0A7I8K9Z2_SPIIN|nr:unnamed protein product [Spirodela intermedia]
MGELESARAVFDETPEPDLRSWTLLISAYTKRGSPAEGVELYGRLLRQDKLRPDGLSLIAAAKACGAASDLAMARRVHRDAVRFGLHCDLPLGNALIDMYGRCRSPEGARRVFDAMPHLDVISWTSIIAAFVESPGEALELLRAMGATGTKANAVTLSKVLSICSELRRLTPGRELHSVAVRNGLDGNSFVAAGLIDMYAKCSAIRHARTVFENIPQRDAVSWNVMLAAYFLNGQPEDASELFQRMDEEDGVAPTLASWNSMIAGCTEVGKPGQALRLLAQMQDRGFKPNRITIASILRACAAMENLRGGREIHAHGLRRRLTEEVVISTALVLVYTRCGELELSRRIFSAIPRKDTVAWNTMIMANSTHGHGEEALALFREMVGSGLRPNSVTFVAALSGCSHSNLVEEGRKVFDSMLYDHGVVPDADHHSCMVDILSRAGLLHEAHEFIQKMSLKPTAGAWGALLAGCRVYKNVELGKTAARRLFEIEPDNPGNYVLLSNIFGAAKLWDDASEIRKIMRDRGMTKEPGCSWIQIKNRVFTFVKGDKRNPRSEEIYGFLGEVGERMRLEGFIPDTGFALQDVDEEEKEELLCGHSEKLAVAFGILNLRGESSIRVFKNLRICGDCHSAIKFMAKLTGVRIVVRDSARFHHFLEGACSCRDFW